MGAGTHGGTAGDMAGTYRAVYSGGVLARWRLQMGAWGLFALLQLVQFLLAVRRGDWLLALLFVWGAIFASLLAWLVWSNRTVISPDAVRVKRYFRWRRLAWEEVAEVQGASRWSATNNITVKTASGDQVALDVPDELRDRFIAYVAARRRSTNGPGRPLRGSEDV